MVDLSPQIHPTSGSIMAAIVTVTSAFGVVAPIDRWAGTQRNIDQSGWEKKATGHSSMEKSLTYGSQVAELRNISGLSTEQLARLFGVTRRSVHNWINGHRMISRHTERLSYLMSEIQALPGDSPEEKRNSLFYSVDKPSPYRKLLRTLKRPTRMQYSAFSPLELLEQ